MNIAKAQAYFEKYKECFAIFEGEFSEDIVDNLMDYFEAPYEWWRSGASKLVICIDKDDDFVLKIPFTHTYDTNVGDVVMIPDYCEMECDMYQEAKTYNVSEFFCEEQYIGSFNNIYVYAQERATQTTFDSNYSSRENSQVIKDNKINNSFDDDFVAECIRAFGAASTAAFTDFIETIGINDLHSNNLGYILKDNKQIPKVFDYSGWYEGV